MLHWKQQCIWIISSLRIDVAVQKHYKQSGRIKSPAASTLCCVLLGLAPRQGCGCPTAQKGSRRSMARAKSIMTAYMDPFITY